MRAAGARRARAWAERNREPKDMPLCQNCQTISTPDAVEAAGGRCPYPHCGTPMCMMCGCTDTTPCLLSTDGGEIEPCCWVAPGLCSSPSCTTRALNEHAERARAAYAELAPHLAGAEVRVEARAAAFGLDVVYACALDASGQLTKAALEGGEEELAEAPPVRVNLANEVYTFRLIRHPEPEPHQGNETFAVEVCDGEGNFLGVGELDPFAQSPDPTLWVRCDRAPRRVVEALEQRRRVYQPLETMLTSELTAADAARHDLIVLSVDREQVEGGDTRTVLAKLAEMVADRRSAELYRDKIEVTFDGYGDDPREVWEIPEVAAFVRALAESFDGWFYICHPQGVMLRTLAFSTCRIEVVTRNPLLGTGVKPNNEDLAAFLRAHFDAVNRLYARLGLDTATLPAITDKVATVFGLKPPDEDVPAEAHAVA